jgi:PAS domain S-box-containing protein
MDFRKSKDKDKAAFTGSLARTVIIGLVVLAMLPAGLMALATYFRSRTLLTEQANSQIQTTIENHSQQLSAIVAANQNYLNSLLSDEPVKSAIADILADPSEINHYFGYHILSTYNQTNKITSAANIDQILVVDPNAKVLISSKEEWQGLDLSKAAIIAGLVNKTSSIATLDSGPLYPSSWIIYSARPILNNQNQPVATVIVTSLTTEFQSILASASSLFPTAKAYYLTNGDILASQDDTYGNPEIIQMPSTQGHLDQIKLMIGKENEGSGQYTTIESGAVLSYGKYIPDLQLTFILEVPEEVFFKPINAMIPFNGILFGLAILFAIVVTYLGSRRIVTPLIELAGHARQFAQGDWATRAVVKSRDEIGLLADSFNHMVGQISDLYRSMELKVDERTQQLRTASEVGQIASSADNREEIMQRAVHLIVERFGYSFASILTLDETGTGIVLQEASHPDNEMKIRRGYRIPATADSLIGWVALQNQARVVNEPSQEKISQSELLAPETRAEIALPISIGKQVLGVLEVQTSKPDGFEPETVSVLQTVSNQIANGLQNLRLLEATQINLEETSLLYRTSRQVSLTKSSVELFQTLSNTLIRTPYVGGVFTVHEDHLSIESITDARSTTAVVAPQGISLPLKNITQRLSQNSLVIVDNLTQASDFDVLLSFFGRRGCRSAALFSIFEEGKLSRIIVLGSRSLAPLTSTGLQPFANLVEVISITLDRFRVTDDLQKRVNELQTLTHLSEIISAETDLTNLYKVLHQQVIKLIGSDISFAIALYDAKKDTINIPYLYENNELLSIELFQAGEGLTSILIRNRKPLMMVRDTEEQARALGAKILGRTAQSWLGVPLIVGGEVVGALILQDTLHEERFTESDLNLFVTLAPQIGTAIRNAQLLAQMHEALMAYDQERFLLNTLMDNIPDHITFKEKNGKFIRVSRSYAAVYKIENPLELIGKSVQSLMPEEPAAAVQYEDEAVIATGARTLSKIEKQTYDGFDHWLLTSKIPMKDETVTPVGVLGIARDITELKNTEELAQKRAQQLQIAAEIARDTTATLDTQEALSKAVNLIRDRFGFYHASIFILDSLGEFAILKEAAGEIGAVMKQRGHRLAVGSQSIVGQATARKEILVINDVLKEPNYYPNPLLPETRAELTIPLLVGQRVLGAVDVQSKESNVFTPDEIGVLKILADQLAIAVLNNTLYARTQENLGQHRLLHQITVASASAQTVDDALEITVQALRTSWGGGRVSIFMVNDAGKLEVKAAAGYEGKNLSNMTRAMGEGIVGMAALERKPFRVADTANNSLFIPFDPEIRSELAVPILYSDKLVGVLNLENTEPGTYDETDQEILGSLGNTLGAVIANAQLVLTVRRQVERQRMLYETTNKIRRSVDIDAILKTSTSEICKALGADRASIEINLGQQQSENRPKTGPLGGNGNHRDSNNGHGGKQ